MPVPVPVSAPLPKDDSVTATLPEEGLDLRAELGRYQDWLVDQALIRTNGNRARAARLLGIERTCLVEMLRTGSGVLPTSARRSAPRPGTLNACPKNDRA